LNSTTPIKSLNKYFKSAEIKQQSLIRVGGLSGMVLETISTNSFVKIDLNDGCEAIYDFINELGYPQLQLEIYNSQSNQKEGNNISDLSFTIDNLISLSGNYDSIYNPNYFHFAKLLTYNGLQLINNLDGSFDDIQQYGVIMFR
jgi:hypothetical protein